MASKNSEQSASDGKILLFTFLIPAIFFVILLTFMLATRRPGAADVGASPPQTKQSELVAPASTNATPDNDVSYAP